MKIKSFLNQNYVLVVVGTLTSLFLMLQMRVQSILPAIMQDEYIYSIQSRKVPLAELDYPNYHYSWLYYATNACGVN